MSRAAQVLVPGLLSLMIVSQMAGTFIPRPLPVWMADWLGAMQTWTGAAGNFHFFAGPPTSLLAQTYRNVDVRIERPNGVREFLLASRLSAGQALQLRLLLARTQEAGAQESMLDKIATHLWRQEPDATKMTLGLVEVRGMELPQARRVLKEKTYSRP